MLYRRARPFYWLSDDGSMRKVIHRRQGSLILTA
jgi:hypothetical protein